jgi:hypothetical protein
MRILFFMLFFMICNSSLIFSKENADNFLMGGVVKSDVWEIDRKLNLEYFNGNVYFKNYYHELKANSAVYNHNIHKWNALGRVYIKRNLDSESYAETFCDMAEYMEDTQIAKMDSKHKKLKLIYYTNNEEAYTAYSVKAVVEALDRRVTFYDKFELYASSISVFSDKAVYDGYEKTFDMTLNPYAMGYDEKYDLYLKGDELLLLKNDETLYAYNNVYGLIKNKKEDQQ